MRQLAHAEIVHDEQRHGGEIGEEILARAVEGGVGQFFDEDVRLAVDDAMALLDCGATDSLGWRAGDVVAIDNYAVSHGRMPYSGPRKIAVAWAA